MTDGVTHVAVRPGEYHDSVTLLRASQAAATVPGVSAAQIAMATPLNRDLAQGLGFDVPTAGPNDLLVTIAADGQPAVDAALAAISAALTPSAPGAGAAREAALRSVRAACRAAPDAGVVLLSVPGPGVLGPALDAIDAGRHVMVFSDNVPVEHEIALKDAAAAAGVLVMGPDCGTAILGGVGLGFANVLRTGASGPAVGVVAASGTGAQQLTCLLDDAGVRISHVLGVGGRDLSTPVGGRSTLAALAVLDRDPHTDHIVVLSKPPAPAVADRVAAAVRRLATPVSMVLLGAGQRDISVAARDVVERLGAAAPQWARWVGTGPDPAMADRPGAALRGLFGGGTLADEAMLICAAELGPVVSNIPLRPDLAMPAERLRAGGIDLGGLGHAILDLGDDAFTRGRPHPMIDPSLRLQLLATQAADPGVGAVMFDVVLGHAADPDPAGSFASAIRAAIDTAAGAGRGLTVAVSLIGTAGDPQGRDAQASALRAAGAQVYASNAAATRAAIAAVIGVADVGDMAQPGASTPADAPAVAARADSDGPEMPGIAGTPVPDSVLDTPAAVIAAGVALLADAVRDQAVPVIEVDARPVVVDPTSTPDDPDTVLSALDDVLLDPRRAAANALAAQRMLAVRARLVDVRPARDVLGLGPREFCHAGPPIGWDRASGPLRGALIGALLFEGSVDDSADTADSGAWSGNEADAIARLSAPGGFSLTPCHERGAVGPMAGVISPSMWLFELEDGATGRRAWCSLNEGLGQVLRYGAFGPRVIARLRWMSEVLGPALSQAVRSSGGVDITAIIGQMLQMGDEGHNRNRAGTLMLLRELLPALIASGLPSADIAEVARFVGGNDHFFLNLVMPAGKLMGDAAAAIPGSTIVTAMCRNGTDFGVRVSGTGDTWFTGPALTPVGLYLPGFGPEDANPDIGDSAIAETVGIGGMSMAAAPAIVRFVGGSVPDALATTERMYEITETENPAFAIPVLEFRGAPTGIDVTRVLRSGILPQINTGMAGRVAGTGQVGAGLVTPPMACFTAAIRDLATRTHIHTRPHASTLS